MESEDFQVLAAKLPHDFPGALRVVLPGPLLKKFEYILYKGEPQEPAEHVQAHPEDQAGQALMALVPLQDAWITANYKERQITYIRPGQKVEFRVDAYPGRTFSGQIDSIMAGTGAAFSLLPPENATGNYVKVVQRVPVKIVFDKDETKGHELRPGMSVVPKVWTK